MGQVDFVQTNTCIQQTYMLVLHKSILDLALIPFCNAPVPGREPARHGASVPLRFPVENRRDTDVSLRHRIGKDDLCNTNMSRQNKNLTRTHAHSRKNAGTELTKSKLRLENNNKC